MAIWHARFAAAPRDTTPAHRPWSVIHDALDEVLVRREERVLSKALTFRAGGNLYCVKTSGSGIALRGARVSLYRFLDGTLKVRYKDRIPTCTAFRKSPTPTPAEYEKTLGARLDAIMAGITVSDSRSKPPVTQDCG
jgi:hypothetical protein